MTSRQRLIDDQNREAIELLYFGYRNFTALADKQLNKRGLARSHHRILYFIGRNEQISVSRLIDILNVSKQALNPPLKQLISMDLVKQTRSEADRRVKRMKLTAQGKRLEQILTRQQRGLLDQVFSNSGEMQTAGWFTVMQNLSDAEV